MLRECTTFIHPLASSFEGASWAWGLSHWHALPGHFRRTDGHHETSCRPWISSKTGVCIHCRVFFRCFSAQLSSVQLIVTLLQKQFWKWMSSKKPRHICVRVFDGEKLRLSCSIFVRITANYVKKIWKMCLITSKDNMCSGGWACAEYKSGP